MHIAWWLVAQSLEPKYLCSGFRFQLHSCFCVNLGNSVPFLPQCPEL